MLLMGLWTMNAAARLRLFGIRHAFDEPGVMLILVLLGLGLTICPLVILGLGRAGRLSPGLKNDLWQRYYSWLAVIPAIAVPIVLGAFWTILAVCVLSLFCFREFARATGFFREKPMNVLVLLGIIALSLASVDHWYRLFVALTPIVVIAAVSTSLDRPKGYIQARGDGEPRVPALSSAPVWGTSGLTGNPCLLVKPKLLDHIFATLR